MSVPHRHAHNRCYIIILAATNPDGLTTNCVFVTIARLINERYSYLLDNFNLIDAEDGMQIDWDHLKKWLWKIRDQTHAHVKWICISEFSFILIGVIVSQILPSGLKWPYL